MAAETTLGVITEQGDLGLGFDPVTEEEEKKVRKSTKKKSEDTPKEEE